MLYVVLLVIKKYRITVSMREEMPYGLFLQHRKVKASAFEVLKSIVVSENNTIPNDKQSRHKTHHIVKKHIGKNILIFQLLSV